MRQLETIWRKDMEEGREDDRERYSSLISRWNSSAFLLHTLEDLVTPEFTVPPTIRISRRGSKNPPLFPAPRFIIPVAGIRDDKPATIHPRARSARNAQDLVVARGSRGENGVEMAVHGWPTALCELFQAQVMFEACAHARIRAYTHTSVENGNGGYGPVVAG